MHAVVLNDQMEDRENEIRQSVLIKHCAVEIS
jgi:hypothetical protein